VSSSIQDSSPSTTFEMTCMKSYADASMLR